MSTPPRYSADAKWWWDGQRWVPVNPAQTADSPVQEAMDAAEGPNSGKAAAFFGGATAFVTLVGSVVLLFQHMNSSPPPPNPPSSPSAVTFTIADDLGPLRRYGLTSEKIAVTVDGQSAGTITVDTLHPQADIRVQEPHAGTFNYQLSSSEVFVMNGVAVDCGGQGSGSITVEDGDTFDIDFAAANCPLQLFLQSGG